jgi:hypothetical protein
LHLNQDISSSDRFHKDMEKGEIIKQLSQLSNSFDKAQRDFLRDHPNIDASNYARATVFTHCYLVLDSIYVCLVVRSYEASLLSSPGLDLEYYLKLMKLLRLLRNSLVHNSGSYILKDDNAGWDSVSIDFRKGQMIQLGESGWKVMFVIGNGIREMLQKVVNSDLIIKNPL